MNALLLGMLVMLCATDASPALQCQRAAVASVTFNFDLPESASPNWPGGLREALGSKRPRELVMGLQATSTMRPNVDRILALAVGASLGFVVGGRIGYALTPKRGPFDDSGGLKGVVIGGSIGAVVGALIAHRLTR